MSKEKRIGNTRKKSWQEGDSNSKTKGTSQHILTVDSTSLT